MFFFIFLLLLLIGRANSFLLGFEVLNPDEVQMMANALGLVSRDFQIYEFDGNTSGVLNSLILAWPYFFKIDITFFSTRLTAISLIALSLYLAFKTINIHLKTKTSLIITLPTILFFSLTKDPDYLHYSSELVSTFLLLLSYWIFTKNFKKQTIQSCFILMFCLGLIFFAKIQFFLPAITLSLAFIINIFIYQRSIKKIFVSCFAFFLPIILILAPYIINFTLNDFIINYFEFPKDYVASSQKTNPLPNIIFGGDLIDNNEGIKNIFFKHMLLNSAFHIFYLYFLSFIIFIIFILRKNNFKKLMNIELFSLVFLILSIIASILIPGRTHRHYLITLIPFLPIFLAIIIRIFKEDINYIKLKKIFIINVLVFLFFLTSLFSENFKFYSKRFDYTEFRIKNIYLDSPKIFKHLEAQSMQKLYIWGWMPQWYVLSYLAPSSRGTISEKLIEENSYKDYYRNRLLVDIEKYTPDLIIDFVKPGSFRHNSREFSLNTFTKLKNFVSKSYIELNKDNVDCPTYYLKDENYRKLKNKMINYSIEHNSHLFQLNDFSVTEDICIDYVIFNEGDNQEIILNFAKEELVKKIMILSSKKNLNNEKIEFSFNHKGENLKKTEIFLNPYPFWTTYILNSPVRSNSLQINIKNLKNKNYGLNEIKIFRE